MAEARLRSGWYLAGLLAVLLAGCAHFQQREIVISAARLDAALAKRLLVERKLLDVFAVKTERPKVSLDPAAQRLRVDFDLTLVHPFSSRPLSGRAGISGGLGFDAASNAVMLLEPRVETLQLDAVPAGLGDLAARLGTALTGALAPKYPLASLGEKDLNAYGRQYVVEGFEIQSDAVRVKLRAKQ